ncbi:hypothetical protein SMAC4_09545 [Sordaria macrospora]|uniref:WGS project CABT00000000 data, contig 2.31 n=1 Tax=Sordaria macrospora (strain ATCC MYA-333 / DSM 997 / K(L3346) / K-hell) TaxID=771870 RepID=F7W5H6_SORMK|nr:uncharacterized protein SMAC_09545 [Sordaria macrospora k-hell]WPJ66179.1 hypothetical protein SMAC4_09545 [Sordaria macrospora]CCC12764.1 unnamed protein product [Sordaria macrospora k-hell]
MSSPAKQAQSPTPEAQSPKGKGKGKSPTPGPASPVGKKSPTPAPVSPAADDSSEPVGLLSGSHWGEQDVDDDNDSTLGSDVESSTASISSSILQYRTLHGRTFHSDSVTDGEYWGPNDAKANELLDIFHHTMTMALDGKLYTAPLKEDIKTALDVGTGSGVWAIDFGDEFPRCNVIGTDISPSQPSWVPPNVRFEVDDASKEWTFQENFFDYVHIRWLTGTIRDWPALYKEAFKCTKPGGWIEHVDADARIHCHDGTMPDDSAFGQWGPIWKAVGGHIGTEFDLPSSGIMERGLEEAGFTNIECEDLVIPLSPWAEDPKMKQLGLYNLAAMTHDIEGFLSYLMPTYLGWEAKDIANYAATARREYKEGMIHANIRWRIVKAQKPLDA